MTMTLPEQIDAFANAIRAMFRKPEGFDLVAHLSRSQERETKFAGKPMDLIAHITRAIEVGDIRRVFAKYAAEREAA
jgi:hypothetical protein